MVAAFSGGDKLEAWLKKMAATVADPGTLRVGFLEGATYPDGGPRVAQVAAMNEFGGTVEVPERTVPEHEVTLYRSVDKNGDFKNEGRFVKKKKSNFATTHVVPEHKVPAYKITIPSRPFFRQMIAKNSGEWGMMLGAILLANKYKARKSLKKMGTQLEAQLVDSIKTGTFVPLAPATVARKGNDQPLIDTSVMWKSVDSEVN